MAKFNNEFLAFNRGRVSPKALARIDLERTALSADVQTNLIPRKLGSAQVRPGLEYTGEPPVSALGAALATVSVPFVFSVDDYAELEFTVGSSTAGIRVWVDDALTSRPNITAPTITNGAFTSDITSWTDNDESGAASTWLTGGYMALLGTGTNRAIREQQITSTDPSSIHALKVIIERGPVVFKVGSTSGASDYVDATLKTGTHSLAFTPTGDFFIEFSSALNYTVLVDSVAIQENTSLLLDGSNSPTVTPKNWAQSADVVFVAQGSSPPVRIERRDNDSWSKVTYEPEDGPFGTINLSEITMTPSATTGDITLTTNKDYWGSNTGELFKLVSAGQNVTAAITAQNTFTASIYVTGVASAGRTFSITISNTFSATVTLQRSEDDSTWSDVETWTAGTAETYDDKLDNQQWYYRIGVKTGDFTSGTADVALGYNGGSRIGIVKITSITSTTIAAGVVLSALGSTTATLDWYRSQWSSAQGYPTAVALFEGRLWWAGKGKIWGSVVDGYESFDAEVVGDSGPVNRILGEGAFDDISWLLPLDRLLIGTPTGVLTCRSNSFDEPLTPTNFNIKKASDEGAADYRAVSDGQTGYYINRAGSKLIQLSYSFDVNNYITRDLCALIPEIGSPYFKSIALQKAPDTRVHCVRNDGTVGLMLIDADENVLSWIDVEVGRGEVSAVYVLPGDLGDLEDNVYYHTDYNEGAPFATLYRNKWARESAAEGGSSTTMLDHFITYSSPGTDVLTGLDHLSDTETVYAWVDGVIEGPYTVGASKQITISTSSATTVCVGVAYTWQWKSAKLAYGANFGSSLLQKKRVGQLGIIAQNIHPTAFDYGPDFTNMNALPVVENGQTISTTAVRSVYDEEMFPFDGEWDTDSRICLQSTIPYPCTLLALIYNIETHSKS